MRGRGFHRRHPRSLRMASRATDDSRASRPKSSFVAKCNRHGPGPIALTQHSRQRRGRRNRCRLLARPVQPVHQERHDDFTGAPVGLRADLGGKVFGDQLGCRDHRSSCGRHLLRTAAAPSRTLSCIMETVKPIHQDRESVSVEEPRERVPREVNGLRKVGEVARLPLLQAEQSQNLLRQSRCFESSAQADSSCGIPLWKTKQSLRPGKMRWCSRLATASNPQP